MVTFFDLMVKIVSALNTFIRVEEQELTEEQQAVVRTNINAASKTEVENLRADMEYLPIEITGISNDIGIVEMGVDVPEMAVSWSLNKTPASQTLDGEELGVDVRSMTVSMEGKTSVTLFVTDERDITDSASTGYKSYNGIYYGASAEPETLDSAFILGLTKELSGSRGRTITVNAAEGQRIWYALPVRLGDCSFAVGGFSGGFDLVSTFKFTNASGYTEAYNVYASAKTGLGETKVVIT